MELRICEHDEPSHIHVPRPSRAAPDPEQIHSFCPADLRATLQDQRDERTAVDCD